MTETHDLKPASESPWYVLMTVAGEQTGFLIDDDLHARNLRFWDGWAGGSLSDTAKAALVVEGRRLLFDALRAGCEKWRETKSRGPDASVANREKIRFAFSYECLKDERLETHSAGKISNGWLRR